MKQDKDEPQGVWDYQTVAAQPRGKKYKADSFCRSCGHELPKRSNPIGIQFFYCEPNCALDAAIHAAAKGYASHLYIKARHRARFIAQRVAEGESARAAAPPESPDDR